MRPNSVAPFIGAMLAALLCGPLTDYVAKRMSKANSGTFFSWPHEVKYRDVNVTGVMPGIFEPEFRLVLVVFYAVFGAMGFFGWG